MKQFTQTYYRFLQHILTFMLVLLVIPVLIQIFSRFIPFIPRLIWTEEIARFAFVWIIMIGSSIAVRDKTHFFVDILPKMPRKSEGIFQLILMIFMLLLALVFILGGYMFTKFGSTQHSEIAGLPMIAIYIAWPLAGLSWVLFLLEQLYDHFDTTKTA